MKALLLVAAVCFILGARAQVGMSFGKGDKIDYDLQRGTYSLTLNGRTVFSDAYALCRGSEEVDSRKEAGGTYGRREFVDATGKGILYTVKRGRMEQLFYLYPSKHYFITEVRVREISCNYMSPLTASGVVVPAGKDTRALAVPFDNDMWVRYDAKELAHAQFTSSEVTALYSNENYSGLVIGSLEHAVWKTGVKVEGRSDTALASLSVFGGFTDSLITHDRMGHGAVRVVNGFCSSPRVLVGEWGDWREGLETFGRLSRLLEPRKIFNWEGAVPMVWNSWGAMQTKLTYDKAIGVVDFFHDSCKAFRMEDGSLFIDLDSYWDNMGSIDGDDSKLAGFVRYCKSKGFRPGVYWTPFVDWGKFDRNIEGSSHRYAEVWTTQRGKFIETDGGRAMDPTALGTRDRIRHVLGRLKALGFEMIKIDFLTHGAIEADHFYDTAVTTGMAAYQSGMELVDSVLGRQMLVYAAISPNLATSRFVHSRRIACDAFSAIDNSEYTLNSTGYGWWQDRMYDFVDADHVVFGTAPAGMNRARLASSLVTGTLTTGDDYSEAGRWRGTAKDLLQNKDVLAIARVGKAFRPVEANTGKRGVSVFYRVRGKDCDVVVFNYGSDVLEREVSLPRLGLDGRQAWRAKEVFSGAEAEVRESLKVRVPREDAVIYRLRAL